MVYALIPIVKGIPIVLKLLDMDGPESNPPGLDKRPVIEGNRPNKASSNIAHNPFPFSRNGREVI